MSSGKSCGHERSDTDRIRPDTLDASSSNAVAVITATDASTDRTRAARSSSSGGSALPCRACCPPSWWIGAAGRSGATRSILRRSTTSWAAVAVTATAQP